MKLHLPKQLFTALLAAITLAAAPTALTLGSAAWGAEETSESTDVQADYSAYDSSKYGYKIVRWQGSPTSGVNYSVCYAPYQLASYTKGEFSFTNEGVVTANPYQTYVIGSDYYTFMIDDVSVSNNTNTACYDIDGVKWSGIIVTEDSSVAKLEANKATGRSITLGKADSNDAGYTSIARDFELNLNNNSLTIAGTQTWDIVGADTTFKISNISSSSQISQGAQLTIKGQGEVLLASALINNGSITIQNGATFKNDSSIVNNGTIVLSSTMQGSGTVTNGEQGRINLGNYTLHQFNDVKYTDGDSGFVKSLTVFGEGVTYTGNSVAGNIVYVGETGYEISNGSIELNGADKTYYVNSDRTYDSNTMAGVTGFRIAELATLTLNDTAAVTAKLAGEGLFKYNLDPNKNDGFNSTISLDDSWTGTVKISDYTSLKIQLTKFNHLSNEQSWLELSSVQGYLWSLNGNDDDFTANLNLVNGTTTGNEYAIRLNDGGSSYDASVTFSGRIKGDGDIWYSFKGDNGKTATHTFTEDLSGWDGKFIRKVGSTDGKNVNATFTAGGNVFHENGNGGVIDDDKSNKLFVIIDTRSNNSVLTTFNGSISDVNTLTVTTATNFMQTVGVNTLVASDNTSFAKNLTVAGTSTVSEGKTLTLGGGENSESKVNHSIGTLTAGSATVALGANSSLTLGAATHAIGTLTGSGALNMSSTTANASATVATLAGYTGTITIDKASTGTATFKATTGGKVTLSGISVLNGAKVNIHTNQGGDNRDVGLGNVTLTGGATLSLSSGVNGANTLGSGYIVTVDKLNISGGGELKTASDRTFDTEDNEGWQARFDIATLKGATTNESTLRLASTSNTSARTVFNLSTSDAQIADVDLFSGNINLGVDNGGSDRKAALNIKNAKVAKNAIIHLENSAATSGEVALGIATDGVQVRGITDAVKHQGNTTAKRYIESGEVGAAKNTSNQLIIATQDASDDFTTSATVGSHLNLQKDGAGSQTFNGNLSAFNGAVTVNQGTLALKSTSAMNNVGDIKVTGGELIFNAVGNFTGTVTMTGGAISFTSLGDIANTVSISNASFAVSSWDITKTQEFNTSGDITMVIGALNIAPSNTLEASGETQNYFTHTYEGTEASSDGNGYQVQSGDFILFKGLEWNETAWGTLDVDNYGTIKTENGNTLVTVSHSGSGHFFINNTASYNEVSTLGTHGIHIVQGASLGLNIADEQTLSTTVEGAGALEKTGTGTLTITGSNTYSGGTTVSSGILKATGAGNLGSGTVSIASGAKVELSGTSAWELTNSLTNNGTLTKTGDASVTITGSITGSGLATIENGELILKNDASLGRGEVTIKNGATLTLNVNSNVQLANTVFHIQSGGLLRVSDDSSNRWDMFGYSGARTMYMEGTAELALGSTRQTVGNWTFDMTGGTISGSGQSEHPYALDFHRSGKFIAHATEEATESAPTVSTVSATIRTKEQGTLTLDVEENAQLNLTGNLSFALKTIKSGSGVAVISGSETTMGELEVQKGMLKLSGNQMTSSHVKVIDGATVDVTSTLTADSVKLGVKDDLATATINKIGNEKVSMTKAKLSSTGISSADTTGSTKGSISNANVQLAQLAEDASFTIQDMTLTNTTITAATAETRVNLNNVNGDATLAQGTFHVQGTLPVSYVGAGGTEVSFSSTALSGLTLAHTETTANLVVDLGDLSCLTPMNPGKYDLTITLSGFSMAEDGTANVLFAENSWLGQLLSQANNADVEISYSPVTVGGAGGDEGVAVSYSTGNVGTIITISGLNVPEPTTATLSLLALAALAARRRRNN